MHYVNPPKIFTGCEGSYMYDDAGTAYLDLQMWYSAVNFGYKNKRLEQKMIEQLQSLPQVASQYLHPTKIELAKFIAQDAERSGATRAACTSTWAAPRPSRIRSRSCATPAAASLMFAFEGGYHGRTLGASSITSSYRYRRRYGHFGDRAQFIPFPYPFRRPKGMTAEEYSDSIVKNSRASSRTNTTPSGTPRPTSASTRPSTSSPSRARAATSCRRRISSRA